MPLWPNDAPVVFQRQALDGGGSLSSFSLSAHSGTHVDAPCHMLSKGADASQLSLEKMCGIAKVCDLSDAEIIDFNALSGLALTGVKRLLIKTSNSAFLAKHDSTPHYAYLTEDATRFILKLGIEFLAIDCLSVDAFDSCDYPVHRLLLEAGVIILEGVDLSDVSAGDYELLCLPLKIATDGAPARVILRTI